MKKQSDSKHRRSVSAEFDQDFSATAHGGAALVEKVLRSLDISRIIKKHLPKRSDAALYSTEGIVSGVIGSLLVGGRGIGAMEIFRNDPLLSKIFGFDKSAPSPPTVYRMLCELSGLVERNIEDVYETAKGPVHPKLDMFGQEKTEPSLRRIVPETPEKALEENIDSLKTFESKIAIQCGKRLPTSSLCTNHWYTIFGDATDLEVDGQCFDAARIGRDGKKILRWQTLMLGGILVAQQLHEGNIDEGISMPRLIEDARKVVREIIGANKSVLTLLDAAYFEKQVLDLLSFTNHWDFIACANQQRRCLERIAQERPENQWEDSGADAARGWSCSQVCCFTHEPQGWSAPVTIIARRWQTEGEITGIWHYSFIATRIEPGAMPKKLIEKYGYCEALWMLYSTKQGHENHYKTALRDLGLHHPPSCRLGINQAFYAIASAAANIAMVLRYRVVPKSERGITLWRLRELYFRISGRIRRGSRYIHIILSGGNVCAKRQVLWRAAFDQAALI